MRLRLAALLAVCLALVAGHARAAPILIEQITVGGFSGAECTAAQVSGATCGLRIGGFLVTVTDAASGSSCTTGGGSTRLLCGWKTAGGGSWEPAAVYGASSHSAVTLSGTPDYITINGSQVIARGQIDLATDVTGALPDANVANDITVESTATALGIAGRVRIGHATTDGSASCLARDSGSDRVYGDKDCDTTKDAGEEFLDETGGGGGGAPCTPSATGDMCQWNGAAWVNKKQGDFDGDGTYEQTFDDANDKWCVDPPENGDVDLCSTASEVQMWAAAPKNTFYDTTSATTTLAAGTIESQCVTGSGCAEATYASWMDLRIYDYDGATANNVQVFHALGNTAASGPAVTIGDPDGAAALQPSSITIKADSTGDAELVLVTNSVGANEISFADQIDGSIDEQAEIVISDVSNYVAFKPDDDAAAVCKITVQGIECPAKGIDWDFDGDLEVGVDASPLRVWFDVDSSGTKDYEHDLTAKQWEVDLDGDGTRELFCDATATPTYCTIETSDNDRGLRVQDTAPHVAAVATAPMLALIDNQVGSGVTAMLKIEGDCTTITGGSENCNVDYAVLTDGTYYPIFEWEGTSEDITIGDQSMAGTVTIDAPRFAIPIGAAVDVAAAGRIGIDDTAPAVVFNSGGTEYQLDPFRVAVFQVNGFSTDGDWAWFKAPSALTLIGADCLIDDVGATSTADVKVRECNSSGASCGDSNSTAIACTESGAAATLTDTAVDAGDWIRLQFTTTGGTPDSAAITLRYRVNRQ